MKKSILIAALLALVAAPAANATVQVWFDIVGSSSNAGLDPLGAVPGPGQRLDLLCDTSLSGRCDWVVRLMAANDTGNQAGWSLDLGVDPNSPGANKAEIKTFQYGGTSPFPDSSAPIINGGGGLLLSAGQSATPPLAAGYAPVVLAQFVLSKHKLVGDSNIHDILSQIGGGEFGGDDNGPYEMVAVGPNAPVAGQFRGAPWPYNFAPYNYNYQLPEAVIRITNVPEPATIGVLAIGVLALIRRRK